MGALNGPYIVAISPPSSLSYYTLILHATQETVYYYLGSSMYVMRLRAQELQWESLTFNSCLMNKGNWIIYSRKKKIPPKSSLKEELTYCLSTKPNGSEWGDGDMFCMVNIHLTITVFLSHSHVAGQCNSTGQWRWRVHHQRHSKSPAIHQWELLNVDRPMRRNTRIILYALYSAIRIMFSAGTPCR